MDDGLRTSFMPYPWADNRCAGAWAQAWSHADVWCCPRGHVRLIYDHADTDVAHRLSGNHIRSAHEATPSGEGDLADTSLWVTHRGQTMDCYIITENTLPRVLAMPERDYATFIEPVSILSTPSVTWWRNPN